MPHRTPEGPAIPAAPTPQEPQPHPQPWLLTTLALLTTVTAVVSSLGAPLVPVIAEEHGVSLHDAQWTLTATMLMGAVSTPVLGRLGSGRHRRRVVLAGLGVVLLGLLLAALPLGFAALLAGRTLQGVGLALTPLAIAAARDGIRGPRLPGAVALLSVTTVAGAGLGYPVTGLVAQVGGIQGAFWFGLVLCALTLAAAVAFLPPVTDAEATPVDWTGAVLLGSGTAAVLLAVSQGGTWGWSSVTTLATAALGLVALVGWVAHALRTPYPLVDLRLALRRGVVAAHATGLAGGVGMYMILTLSVVLMQSDDWGLGQPVSIAALVLVPYSLMSVLGSRVSLAVGRRMAPELVLPIGCLLYVVAASGMALWHGHVWLVLVWMALAGLGSGGTFASMPGVIVRHVPQAETASALSFNQVLRYLGMSIGTTLGVTVMALASTTEADEQGLEAALWTAASIMAAAALTALALTRQKIPATRP
ncbi:MFS transporter [Nocardioides pacificus]